MVFEPGACIYEGPFEGRQQPYGLALSDLRLRDGTVKVNITFEDLTDAQAGASIVPGFHSEAGSIQNLRYSKRF